MDQHSPIQSLPNPVTSEDDEASGETDTARKWQRILSDQKKQCAKMKRRMRGCRATLEQQDEKLKRLQEQIAAVQLNRKDKTFNWSTVKAAHLLSKVFENCEPVVSKSSEISVTSSDDTTLNNPVDRSIKSEENLEIQLNKDIVLNPREDKGKKCLYTVDFHRFAIALYFFSPTTYFFMSNLIPIFPHQNYIRQWVAAGRVEKLFPRGVFRESFN